MNNKRKMEKKKKPGELKRAVLWREYELKCYKVLMCGRLGPQLAQLFWEVVETLGWGTDGGNACVKDTPVPSFQCLSFCLPAAMR
jgi:hypothetical protein